MRKLEFNANAEPTLGVELELALVDARTMALSSSIGQVLERVPAAFAGSIKPELMQSYLEINSAPCRTVGEIEADLREKVLVVERITDELGLRLLWSATHPFSLWRDQQPTPSERYAMLLNLLQDMGRQLVTFGLHVHVGVDSGDKAILVLERMTEYLPVLLALSANSPCWDNRVTGLQSSRSKIMEALPTAGLPTLMRNWSEYTWLINHLVETGFINTIREIWWDVRPHHNFGTVEVRICDMPDRLEDALALTALIQCLVKWLSDAIDEGASPFSGHPMLIRQNKWRAARYGPEARLVDCGSFTTRPVRAIVDDLVRRLWPVGEQLQCQEYLGRALRLAAGPSGASRQLALLAESDSPAEAVRRLTEGSRLGEAAATSAG
jgi:carboxylate-amine ligase